jgi:hypothetical protein
MSKMAMRAPSSAMRMAQARPMPTLPPVITAVFPESLFMLFLLSVRAKRQIICLTRGQRH